MFNFARVLGSPLPLADYLEPLDWLKLMQINKATRSIAAGKLREHETKSPMLQAKRIMFQAWLQDPTNVNENNGIFREEMSAEACHQDRERYLAGPLRLDSIGNAADKLSKNFIILDYQRSYLLFLVGSLRAKHQHNPHHINTNVRTGRSPWSQFQPDKQHNLIWHTCY